MHTNINKIYYSPSEIQMKNGQLVVINAKAKDLDINAFNYPGHMSDWEQAAYIAYEYFCSGEIPEPDLSSNNYTYCNEHNINTLEDLFGKEFNDKFFCKKNLLLNKLSMNRVKNELKHLNTDFEYLNNRNLELEKE